MAQKPPNSMLKNWARTCLTPNSQSMQKTAEGVYPRLTVYLKGRGAISESTTVHSVIQAKKLGQISA